MSVLPEPAAGLFNQTREFVDPRRRRLKHTTLQIVIERLPVRIRGRDCLRNTGGRCPQPLQHGAITMTGECVRIDIGLLQLRPTLAQTPQGALTRLSPPQEKHDKRN